MAKFEEIVNAGRNFYCELYRLQPGYVVDIPPLTSRYRMINDAICGKNPDPAAPALPLPPAPPFSGGQCQCSKYRVNFTMHGTNIQPVGNKGTADVWGAIQKIYLEPAPSNSARMVVVCRGSAATCGAVGTKVFAANWGNVSAYPTLPPRITIDSVVLLSGQNNCGNPPPGYPPPPLHPPTGIDSPPATINNYDNTTNEYYFNFTPPALPAPADFMPPVVINFFQPKINPEFKIPITFNFDGTVNFGSPSGGGGGGNFNQDDRDNINNIKNTTNNNGDKIINLTNEVNNITNNYNNAPENPDDFEPPVVDQPPGEYEQTYLGAVSIALTSIPKNAKTQSGEGAADVIYAGWFEWKKDGWNLPRQPINFSDSYFIAPKGINGFAYTLYNGFDGKATSYIYKEKV